MSSRWIQDPVSGGEYYDSVDEYRRPSQISRRERQPEPLIAESTSSGRKYLETPRYTAAVQDYGDDSSEYPSNTRARRESNASVGRVSNRDVLDYRGPEKRYQDRRGYDVSQDEPSSSRSRLDSFAAPLGDTNPRTSTSSISRDLYKPERRDWAPDSTIDSLADDVETMTIGETSHNYHSSLRNERGVFMEASGLFDKDDLYSDKSKGAPSDSPEPQPSQTQPQGRRHIRGTRGDSEYLDPSYVVRKKDYLKFFQPGRIFSTLWTDPYAGTTNDTENNQFMTRVTYVIYKERVHTKIRRFVVVRQMDRCCHCLPVTTYDGRGYKKRGIKLNEHGLIYSGDHPGEVDGITKQALWVKLSKNGEPISNPSYINYGRIYTVDTNVKVKDVGELDSTSRKLLYRYYREVNFPIEDDYDGRSPAQTPQSRAATLAGVGSGLVPASSYPESQVSTITSSLISTTTGTNYATSDNYHLSTNYNQPNSRWDNASGYNSIPQYPTGGRVLDPQTMLTQATTAQGIRYSAAPIYSMERTNSIPGHPSNDNQFSRPVAGPAPPAQFYTPQTQHSGQQYPLSRDTQYSNRQDYQNPFSQAPAPITSGPSYQQNSYQSSQERGPETYGSSNVRLDTRSQFEINDRRGPSNTSSWTNSPQPPLPLRRERPRYGDNADVDDVGDVDVDLPSLKEAQETHRRRDSMSQSGRSHGSRESGRHRERKRQ